MELVMCNSFRYFTLRLAILVLLFNSQTNGFTISRDKDLQLIPKAPDLLLGGSDILPINFQENKENNENTDKDHNKPLGKTNESNNQFENAETTNVKPIKKEILEAKANDGKTLLDNKNYPTNSVTESKHLETDQVSRNAAFAKTISKNKNGLSGPTIKANVVTEHDTSSKTQTETNKGDLKADKKLLDNNSYSTNSVNSDEKPTLESISNKATTMRAIRASSGGEANQLKNESPANTTDKIPRELIPWKNYKTIERKTLSMMPNDADNTAEKSATVDDVIPYDANLKNLEASTFPDSSIDDSTRSTLPIEMLLSSTEPMRIKLMSTTEVSPSQTTDKPIKFEVMTSKRGGFLDLTNPLKPKSKDSKIETTSNYESPTSTTSKSSETKSQFLLNEAAITDELLMEKVISEKQETANRYAGELNNKKSDQAITTPSGQEVDDKTAGTDLRVQPISKTLYEVSPNYRKMKKIDVVPAKPFLRNPDDNTWRNESLSSMGIVFKAKNSSKSFTEVIRNKTESELVNEEVNKEDQPALRERLEQLAEMRKAKKKKIDKGNDLTNELNPLFETASAMVAEAVEVLTTERSKFDYFESQEDDTTYDVLPQTEIVKNKETTKKVIEVSSPIPRAQESNKKTEPFKEIPYTNIPYIDPNRKATVQYFPPKPRAPEPVSVNDYDAEFRYKMELFTNSNTPIVTKPSSKPSTETTTAIDDDYIDTFKRVYTATHNELISNYYIRPTPLTRPISTSFFLKNQNNENGMILDRFKVVMADVGKDDQNDAEQEVPPRLQGYITHKAIGKEDGEKSIIDRIIQGSQAVDLNMANKHHFQGFPILYNNSVVHTAELTGKALAASTSFLRQEHKQKPITRPKNILAQTKRFDANHEIRAVELASPGYELHYFLPEQEHNAEA